MDGARLSRFPHLSWIGTRLPIPVNTSPLHLHLRSVAHTVCLTLRGSHAVRSVCCGRSQRWQENRGTVHFLPRDGEVRDFFSVASAPCESFVVAIPDGHLADITAAEGLSGSFTPRRLLLHDDAVLQRALLALATTGGDPDEAHGRRDEAARRLVLRLVQLCGGGTPDWHDDHGTFDGRTLHALVDHIDADLRTAPGVGELSALCGISPSHFARKFRRSTGLSLHRFVNRRRIRASLARLAHDSEPLARVAIELGFSSQSHFARQFSGLTGMTPARYRRQFRPTVG